MEVGDWVVVQVLDANEPFLRKLTDRGLHLGHESHVDNYPGCYRVDAPLIDRALRRRLSAVAKAAARDMKSPSTMGFLSGSEFVVQCVTEFKDRMVERNQGSTGCQRQPGDHLAS